MNKSTFLSLTLGAIFTLTSFTSLADTFVDNSSKRTAYLDLIDQQINLMNQMGSSASAERLQNAKNQLLLLTDEELTILPETENLASLKSSTELLMNQAVDKNSPAIQAKFQLAATLTDPDYPDFPLCATAPGVRHGDLTVFISEQALFVAEAVREVASRGCEQVAVVAGFGANTSAACIVTDAIYIAAKEAHNIISFCDAEVDEAQLEAAFLRTGDLYDQGNELSTQLTNHDAAVLASLSQHDSDLKDALSVHDADIKSDLSIHDSDIKAALSQHDSDIKDLLQQVLANQGQMLANQAVIIELLKTPSGRRDGWNGK